MRNYDQWKLACPYDNEPDVGAIADFYDVEPDEVTDKMRMDYHLDFKEREATRFRDWEDYL